MKKNLCLLFLSSLCLMGTQTAHANPIEGRLTSAWLLNVDFDPSGNRWLNTSIQLDNGRGRGDQIVNCISLLNQDGQMARFHVVGGWSLQNGSTKVEIRSIENGKGRFTTLAPGDRVRIESFQNDRCLVTGID